MKRYVIERELPGVGSVTGGPLGEAAARSNDAIAGLHGKVQWVQSFVTSDRTFCHYLAEDEMAVRQHAQVSGFPASRIYEIARIIDPLTVG